MAPLILTLALEKDERRTSGLGLITHGKVQYPLCRDMGGPQSRTGFGGGGDKSLVPAGIRIPDHPVPYLGSYATQEIASKKLKILWNRAVVS